MKLSVRPRNEIEFKGRVYALNLAFDCVLRVFDIWKEEIFTDVDKISVSLDVLIANGAWQELPLLARNELLTDIFNQFIKSRERKGPAQNERVFDFVQDADYIFASFYMDYGIDLIEEQGRLPWDKFVALFGGLSERTKMREVMSVRARKIPARTKHNAEEIRQLQELKIVYALEISEEERERQLERGLDQLFNTLMRQAR